MGYKTYSCYSTLNSNAKGDQNGPRINPHPGGGLQKAGYLDFTQRNELLKENEAVDGMKNTHKRMS